MLHSEQLAASSRNDANDGTSRDHEAPSQSTTTTEASSSNHRKPIKCYTSRITPACRAVTMLATHLNLPLQEEYLRCYIDTRTEKFRKINPCHTVPVIDDDGFILWESRAIMQYLCNKYAPDSDLYPRDPRKRATVDRLLNFDLKTLSHAVIAVHYEFTFPCEYSSSRGEKLIAVTDALTLLEIFLINKNYVACEHLTIADLSILASVTLLEIAVEFDLTSYPNIWNWYTRLRNELPYYDPLTKVAHDEMRTLIQNVRDFHEEWSSPLHQCAFVPNGSNAECIEEQRRQYQRLFLNSNEQQDAARIMAAVSPVFRKHSFTNHQNTGETSMSSEAAHKRELSSLDDSSGSQTRKLSHEPSTSEQSCSSAAQLKRIRLTIEPNTGQCLQLSQFDSSHEEEQEQQEAATTVDNWLLSTTSSSVHIQNEEFVNVNDHSHSHMSHSHGLVVDSVVDVPNKDPCCDQFLENYNLCNETFCRNC